MPNLFTTTAPNVNIPPTTGPDWTNLGPLTTIFTPPPRCFNNGYSGDGGRPFAYIPNRWPSLVFVNSKDVECYPSTTSTPTITVQATGASTETMTFVDFQYKYFSPGICPIGWYSAADYGDRYAGSPALKTDEGEKIAVCCPTGYTPTFVSLTTPDPRSSTGSCLSVLTAPVAAVTCATCNNTKTRVIVHPSATATDPGALDNPSGTDGPQTSVVQVTAVETTILVRWKATDEPLLDSIRAGDEKGLTTGQQAGIGIGVALAVFLLIGAVAGVVILRKRNAAKKAAPVHTGPRRGVDTESTVAYKLEDNDDD